MNKLEARYAEVLKMLQQNGKISWYAFESIKFKLADKTFYTPDFLIMLADGSLEIHEVKGFWEDDARVKIKVAAEKFPFLFVALKYNRTDGWMREEF